MSDLITDERLGHAVGILWTHYVKGLILLSEFQLEVFALLADTRGTDV
jgi:hypothetical protein